MDMVKESEEFRSQLDVAGLTDQKMARDRQVDVRLARPSQAVARYIPDIGGEFARGCPSSGTGNS